MKCYLNMHRGKQNQNILIHFICISALIPETEVLKCSTKCLPLKEDTDITCILNVAGG